MLPTVLTFVAQTSVSWILIACFPGWRLAFPISPPIFPFPIVKSSAAFPFSLQERLTTAVAHDVPLQWLMILISSDAVAND
jgi:hypothetical protein